MKLHETDYLIIGAGLSGLILARRLNDAGKRVVVLEKGRGFGGRMATRRHGLARFDHGAQYFTVRTPEFQALVDEWLRAGVIREWFRKMPGEGGGGGHPRYIGIEGISDVPKFLARNLEVHRNQRAAKVEFEKARWTVETAEGDVYNCRQLVVTAPVPQTMELLDASGIDLPPATSQALRAVHYEKGLAAMALLDGPSGLPGFGGLKTDEAEPLTWLADNRMKGISPGASAITLHSSPSFAQEHWDSPDEIRGPLLLKAARPFLQSDITEYFCHRWGYARPATTFHEPFLANPDQHLLLAGDGFGGPLIEGAARSGLAAAAFLIPGD